MVWRLILHRRAQAAAIAALAALITACAVFAPLYDRAMQQALVQQRLADHPVQLTGLRLTATGGTADPVSLESDVPDAIRRHLGEPVASGRVTVTEVPDDVSSPTGALVWRTGACAHLRFGSGGCPDSAREVAVSEADAQNYGWKVGSRIRFVERVNDPTLDKDAAPRPRLRVVGVYSVRRGDYWFGRLVSGRSGTADPDSGQPLTDDLFVDPSTVSGVDAPAWLAPIAELDFPLDRRSVGVDELLRLGPAVAAYIRAGTVAAADASQRSTPVPYSGLPDIAEEVAQGRDQARVIVPLLMVQLGMLAAVVLWLVLGAATEQRRPEIALARLRGRGARGAARLLLGELVPVGLAGVAAGTAAALGLAWLARHAFLPGNARFELGAGFAVALGCAVAAVLLITVAAVAQVVREPVIGLLRRVPSRRSSWALGVVDAMVIAASAMAVVAFVTGGLTGPLALAAPSLLALAVGLVLAHLLVPVAASIGRRLLARGYMTSGVSVLQLARRPATRRVVAIVTVATALLVFSADALLVGSRNRDAAAQQEVGAPMSAEVTGTDLAGVREALAEVDPDGRAVTPTVSLSPPGDPETATMAVVPDQFRRIALFPGQAVPARTWSALAEPSVPPLRLEGSTVRLRLAQDGVQVGGSEPNRHPAVLALRLTVADGRSVVARVAELRSGDRAAREVRADLPCGDGCLVAGLSLLTDAGHPVEGRFRISALTTGPGTSYDVGGARAWQEADEDEGAGYMSPDPGDDGPRSLTVGFAAEGGQELRMPHAALPARLPALVAGPLPDDADGTSFEGRRLDGVARPMVASGRLERVPAGVPATSLVNLDVLARDVGRLDPLSHIRLLFAEDDPALLARVRSALKSRSVELTTPASVPEARASFDASIAAWSLQLAVVVGIAGLAIAVLVLLVVAATTWRLRSRDFAALRMTGVSRRAVVRIATGEQLPIVVLAVLAGATCGLVGAHFAMPSVPLFASPPLVSTLDLSTNWVAVLASALVAGLLLGGCVLLVGVAMARRSSLERVRESL